jgi:hypothetical protein
MRFVAQKAKVTLPAETSADAEMDLVLHDGGFGGDSLCIRRECLAMFCNRSSSERKEAARFQKQRAAILVR